ncbi:MAG: hypothetical protein FH758_06665 [Firmicutes bacterium]|nr:hypothetical protein [Bacillota bacterium]
MTTIKSTKVIFLITSLAVFFSFHTPAWAFDAEDIEVYVDGDEIDAINDDEDKYIVQSNYVDIEIENEDPNTYTTATVNGEEAEVSGRDWEYEDLKLEPGDNTITVDANGTTVEIIIDYVDAAAPKSYYRVPDITDETSIEVFDGDVVLDIGRNVILEDGRDEIARNQNIDFSIYDREYIRGSGGFNYTPSSRLYRITGGDVDEDDDDIDEYSLLDSGTLTLKYDAKNIGKGLDTLTVLWFKDYDGSPNKSAVENLGGRVNTEENTITVTFPKNGFGYYGVFNFAGNFIDFSWGDENTQWAKTYVMPLYAKGIMQPLNQSSNNFGLKSFNGIQQYITQGEYASMIVKALDLPHGEISGIGDYGYPITTKDPYLQAAASHGLLNGINFSPTSIVTREQGAVMVARAANLRLYDDLDLISRIIGRIYTDTETMSPWAKPYIYAAYKSKYLVGMKDPNYKYRYKFAAQQPLTRVQAAKVVYKLMENKNANQ